MFSTKLKQTKKLKETLGTFLKSTLKEGNRIYFSAGPRWELKLSTYGEGRNAEVFQEQKENWIIHCKTTVILDIGAKNPFKSLENKGQENAQEKFKIIPRFCVF